MNATVDIITGSARTGKTTGLLQDYRAALKDAMQQAEPGSTLWLTPSQWSRRSLRGALLSDDLRACCAPNIFTFRRFADEILRYSSRQVQPLSEIGRRTLLAEIVEGFAQEGELVHFRSIAGTSGFLDLVAAFIAELKREEIWPENFIAACQRRGESRRDRELALIYSRYQERLLSLSVYDSEGRFWLARSAIREGSHRPFDHLSLVITDGFTDFTYTQYEILDHLAHWAERLIVSLPGEPSTERRDLFAKSLAARERMEEMDKTGIEVAVHPVQRRTVTETPVFDHIADHLFANPRSIGRLDRADGIEVLAVTGQVAELEHLAERVKRLLQSGVPASQIVVAFRSLDDHADLIREIFTAAGLPFYCEAGEPLTRTPLLKALLAVLQLERNDWPFEDLMGVLGSGYLRPEWRSGYAVNMLARWLRRWKLHSGRSAMLQALRRRLETAETASEDDSQRESLHAAVELLERFSAATDRLRRKADFATWCQRLLALARDLGIAPESSRQSGTGEELDRRDRAVWNLFERVVLDAAGAQQLLEGEPRRMDLAEFHTRLTNLLRSQTMPPPEDPSAGVLVLEAASVRNLDVPYLFLAGLTEQSFPARHGDDCLYSESERRGFNEEGLPLGHRSSHNQDEMLLFYGIVTRARRQLVLSYPEINSAGDPLFPSPYVNALRDLFKPDALPTQHVGALDPVPSLDCVLTPADLRRVATWEVRQRRPGLFSALRNHAPTSGVAENILASVEMAVRRFHTRGFTEYEGLLQSEINREQLAERFPTDHEFSATSLEAYATCPFRFLMQQVLHIEPLESPEVETDYRTRGLLVHDVLAALHRELFDEAEASSSRQLADRFRELVSQRLEELPGESDLQKALNRIEQDLLFQWADAYGRQWDDYQSTLAGQWDQPPQPAHLEVSFGTPSDGEEKRYDSLEFGSGENRTLVRGRIDRVDVGFHADRPAFNVIDYKTGSPPTFRAEDVASGRALQLVLYTMAVRQLGLVDQQAALFQMGYWCLRESGFVGGLKGRSTALDEAVLQSLEEILEGLIPRLAAGIRTGQFPVQNEDRRCTSFCPYNTVCRVNQIRPLQEPLDKRLEFAAPQRQ